MEEESRDRKIMSLLEQYPEELHSLVMLIMELQDKVTELEQKPSPGHNHNIELTNLATRLRIDATEIWENDQISYNSI